jgi:hypothetical protein
MIKMIEIVKNRLIFKKNDNGIWKAYNPMQMKVIEINNKKITNILDFIEKEKEYINEDEINELLMVTMIGIIESKEEAEK